MRFAAHCIFGALSICLLPACTSLDHMTRPRAAYHAYPTGTTYTEKVTEELGGLTLEVRCIRKKKDPGSVQPDDQAPCAYKAVNEAGVTGTSRSLASAFAKCGSEPSIDAVCMKARSRTLDLLRRISDENCSTFMQQTFLMKSTSDSAYLFGRDVLTGGTAAVAASSAPSAIGLSFANLLVGSYESINSNFFLNEAFQSIETAINLERDERLKEMISSCSAATSYDNCSIHEGMRQLRRYEDACSLRAGLNKLQTLVHLQQNKEVAEAAQRESDELEKQVTTLREQKLELERRNAELDVRPLIAELSAQLKELKAGLGSGALQQSQGDSATVPTDNP